MSRIKNFCQKHRTVIRYLSFGIITTIVSFSMFYASWWVAKTFFGSLEHGKGSTRYLIANITANVLKWCSGVLVAFYTSKKWVFTDADPDASTAKQLLVFAEGRVLTLIMAMVLQYLLELGLAAVITKDVTLVGMTFSAEFIGTTAALLIYSVVEIIANYYYSKKIVFKKKQN
ncbi:MAG: hypothetical protein E7667_03840 [Ruminococcaceae bacterium]|nr:hypothetical protein [Oscillospiraceae bacterium]